MTKRKAPKHNKDFVSKRDIADQLEEARNDCAYLEGESAKIKATIGLALEAAAPIVVAKPDGTINLVSFKDGRVNVLHMSLKVAQHLCESLAVTIDLQHERSQSSAARPPSTPPGNCELVGSLAKA